MNDSHRFQIEQYRFGMKKEPLIKRVLFEEATNDIAVVGMIGGDETSMRLDNRIVKGGVLFEGKRVAIVDGEPATRIAAEQAILERTTPRDQKDAILGHGVKSH